MNKSLFCNTTHACTPSGWSVSSHPLTTLIIPRCSTGVRSVGVSIWAASCSGSRPRRAVIIRAAHESHTTTLLSALILQRHMLLASRLSFEVALAIVIQGDGLGEVALEWSIKGAAIDGDDDIVVVVYA